MAPKRAKISELAMVKSTPSRVLRFGGFVLDVAAYELRKQGRTIKVERRPMELLMLLVSRPGELVTRDEIVRRLWGTDVFIEVGAGVNTVIRKLRRALRDSAEHSRFIEAVRGKGYRFIAAVESSPAAVVAVLPFENLHGDSDLEYVADGLTEETITGLAQIDPERLTVIARTSSMTYRRRAMTIVEIGRALGVDYVLEGSVRAANQRFRIASTLVRVHDHVQVWTETYERHSSDLLGLQAELGQAIARQIELLLAPSRSATITSRHTQNPEAYDFYLRGRYYYNQMTPGTGARALDCYYRATALDPAYALAWAGIAATYSSRLFNSDTKPSDVSDQAHAAAEQALTSGGSVPEAHTSAAIVRFLFDWDWRAAEAHARRAIALDSSSAQAYWMLGYASSQQGRHDEALAAARRARELDAGSALNHSMSAQIAFSARDFQAAEKHASQALMAEPDFWVAHWQLGQARQQMGQAEPALEALREATRLSNGNSKPVSLSAYILATIGQVSEAREMLFDLEQRSQSRYVPPSAMALVYAGLNDDANVFECLDDALTVRDVHLIYAPLDPKWDRFRKHKRFQSLLRQCNRHGWQLPRN
ncbi:MAG: winged helix-turn-helix domain-containing protein [Acidobacteria bacterium]|nr:winged helix-turn-helix domain-containing protein [Acidobacteriota bacterium]